MNDAIKLLRFLSVPVLLLAISISPAASAQGKKTPGGEEFFILSSVDQTKSQVLLKHPTEVTQLMKVDDKTLYQDEQGKAIHLTDLHAGDTVWVIASAPGKDAVPVASRIRKGPMTVKDLHRLYLDNPSTR